MNKLLAAAVGIGSLVGLAMTVLSEEAKGR